MSAPAPAKAAVAAAAAAPQRSPWDDEATRAMPAPDLTTQWFAMVQGKQEGPLDLRALMQKVNAGEVTLRTYLWKPGMESWQRASEVPDVCSIFSGGTGANATATGPVRAAPETQKAPRASSPQRDVATANELPAAEFATVSQIIASPSALVQPGAGATAASAPAASSEPLKDLFNDVHDGQANGTGSAGAGDPDDEEPTKGGGTGSSDPFAALGEPALGDVPPPGEATKFFIAQAGVNRRNPPWKIALFVLSAVVAPATALYLLSTLHVLPQVTVTTEDGEVVHEDFFSPTGIGGLKDMLTGDQKRKQAEAEEKRKAALAAKERAAAVAAAKPKSGGDSVAVAAANTKPDKADPNPTAKPSNVGLADFYNDDKKTTKAPKDRSGDAPSNAGGTEVNSKGLSNDAAMKIVADKKKSFDQCIEAALRRSPNLSVGSVVVTLTVGASGAVKAVTIEPKKYESADWAVCMIAAGKRIVFPSSDGDTDVQVPLKVGVTM